MSSPSIPNSLFFIISLALFLPFCSLSSSFSASPSLYVGIIIFHWGSFLLVPSTSWIKGGVEKIVVISSVPSRREWSWSIYSSVSPCRLSSTCPSFCLCPIHEDKSRMSRNNNSSLTYGSQGRVFVRILFRFLIFVVSSNYFSPVSADKGPNIIVLGGSGSNSGGGGGGLMSSLASASSSGSSSSSSSSSMPSIIGGGGGQPNILVLSGGEGGRKGDKKSNVIIIMQPQQTPSPPPAHPPPSPVERMYPFSASDRSSLITGLPTHHHHPHGILSPAAAASLLSSYSILPPGGVDTSSFLNAMSAAAAASPSSSNFARRYGHLPSHSPITLDDITLFKLMNGLIVPPPHKGSRDVSDREMSSLKQWSRDGSSRGENSGGGSDSSYSSSSQHDTITSPPPDMSDFLSHGYHPFNFPQWFHRRKEVRNGERERRMMTS